MIRSDDAANLRMRWTRAFVWTPIVMLGVFGPLTFYLTNQCLSGPDGPHSREWQVWWTTIATPLGPMTGAIARNWQSCCAENSWELLCVAAPTLALGIGLQFLLRREGRWWNRIRFFDLERGVVRVVRERDLFARTRTRMNAAVRFQFEAIRAETRLREQRLVSNAIA